MQTGSLSTYKMDCRDWRPPIVAFYDKLSWQFYYSNSVKHVHRYILEKLMQTDGQTGRHITIFIFTKIIIAGFYCSQLNATGPTAQCSAGYYCPYNASRHDEIVCDQGKYCPIESSAPKNCPPGKKYMLNDHGLN